jgi:hypothetical protein
MKTCSSCKETKDETAFPFRNTAKGIRQHNCKECYRGIRKRNYGKHRDATKQNVAERKQLIAAQFREYKLTQRCLCCSESAPECLDFHHLDPQEKDFNLSVGVGQGFGWPKILDELQKCVCVCSNCHRKIHAGTINIT